MDAADFVKFSSLLVFSVRYAAQLSFDCLSFSGIKQKTGKMSFCDAKFEKCWRIPTLQM